MEVVVPKRVVALLSATTFCSTFRYIVESSLTSLEPRLYYFNPIAFQLYPIMPKYGVNSNRA